MKQWRAFLIVFLFCAAVLSLGGRLFFLQVANHGFYKALAQGQRLSSSFLQGERGDIFSRDKAGNLVLLAANRESPYVFASPAEIQNPKEAAEALAPILSLPASDLQRALEQDGIYQALKKQIGPEEEQKIRELEIPGIYIGQKTVRYYPQGALASHVLGFVNQDGIGQYGIEGHYDDLLSGKEGLGRNAGNPASQFLASLINTAENGSDIVLTLDYNVQSMAESLLQQAQDTLGVKEGTIVVIDPKTGGILALAELPTFDPNQYADISDFGVFQNNAAEKMFEPGSVFKAMTMASALDAKAITTDTTYEDKGILQIGGYKIYNYDGRTWGKRTMQEVMEFSINTGAVFAQNQLGNKAFLEYMDAFGMFAPTGIDLAGEIYSQNKTLKQGSEINFATASFGQGIEMTPLQLVQAYTALANRGNMVQPRIYEKALVQDSRPVISQESAFQTTSMLVSVIEQGYSKQAKIPGYYIAGKTGTAQIPWSALGIPKTGYSDQTVQSFIGYAPAFDPEFLILVKLNNPQAKTAEYSAMPLFRDLAKYMIDYLSIPPDYEP